MWKFIFLIAIVLLAIHIAKRALAKPFNTQNNNAATQRGSQGSANSEIENMVQCCACHIHLPRSEAFMVEGRFYCSQAHIQRKQN